MLEPTGGESKRVRLCHRQGEYIEVSSSHDAWRTAVALDHRDRTRTPRLALSGHFWEQNGNRTGNISPMSLQCTRVRAVS